MSKHCILTVILVACLAPGFAFAVKPSPPLAAPFSRANAAANVSRLTAARTAARLAISGTVALPAKTSPGSGYGWTAQYYSYVNCTNAAGSNFTTIQDAVIAAVSYTVIQVCAGTYSSSADIQMNTSYVAIVGAGTLGNVTITCALTSSGYPYSAIFLNGSYQVLQNIVVSGCNTGAAINAITDTPGVGNDIITGSSFANNNYGVFTQDTDNSQISSNSFTDNFDGVTLTGENADSITGNVFTQTGALSGENTYGIVLNTGNVGLQILNNSFTGHATGIGGGFYGPPSSYSSVSMNSFQGNQFGMYFNGTGGDVYSGNIGTGNGAGLYLDAQTGADSSFGVPDRVLSNRISRSTSDDYYDGTSPYAGSVSGVDDTTANYYLHNKGKLASPAAILKH